jgi:hypothetical protein
LAVFSAVGYASRRDKSWRDFVVYAWAFAIVPVFFVAIFATFAPQFLVPLQRFVGRFVRLTEAQLSQKPMADGVQSTPGGAPEVWHNRVERSSR